MCNHFFPIKVCTAILSNRNPQKYYVSLQLINDSIDRDSLWKIMKHYGIPDKYISIVKATYDGMTCRVLHGGDI